MIPWLRQRDIALLGGDVPPSVAPSDLEGDTGAVHDFALVYLGVYVFDNVDLEALAEAAQARKRWDFLLTVAPLAIPRRHRLAGESDCDVLITNDEQKIRRPGDQKNFF